MVKPDLVFRGRADNLKRFLGESWSKIPGTGLWIPPQADGMLMDQKPS